MKSANKKNYQFKMLLSLFIIFSGIAFILWITRKNLINQNLIDAATRTETILKTVVDGIITINSQGLIETFNASAEKLFGYTAKEIIGCNINKLMPEPYQAQHNDYLSAYLKTGESKVLNIRREIPAKKKDGSIFQVELGVSAFEARGQKMFVGSLRDISERKENDRIKNEFISVVSHELRTPLTSIRGSLGLIAGAFSQELPEKINHLITIAYNNCERLILLINDILDLEKMNAGKMSFQLQPESLITLLNQAIEANNAFAEKFHVELHLIPPKKDITIQVDKHRFIQVMSNLLSNAAKFSPEKSQVKIFTELTKDSVKISVEDHGSGIPEKFRPHIFEKFSQANTSSTRSPGGTGLGLNIAKTLVTNMKGSIGFNTQTDQGTIFWIEFPLFNTQEQFPTPTIDDSIKKPWVLHIEKDSDFSNMLMAALQDKIQLIHAPSLSIAEKQLQQHCFSLIILDAALEDHHTPQLMKAIQQPGAAIMILSTKEIPNQLHPSIKAAIVKSRTPESKIIETILALAGAETGRIT